MTSAAGNGVTRGRAPAWGRALEAPLIVVIVLGAVVRADGLARRPLWHDEVGTALCLSGASEADVRALYDGGPHAAGELVQRFQRTGDAPLGSAVARVVHSVAVDESPNAPGYFVVASLWTRLAGDGPASLRALSLVASLLTLVLTGVVARRLFAMRDVALAAMALVAVSPLHVRYAQEARAYALWSALLLATQLAVLRASERRSVPSWMLVAVLLAAALYVQPLSALCVPALVLLARRRGAATSPRAGDGSVVAAGLACTVSLLLLTPWLGTILVHSDTVRREAAWLGDGRAIEPAVRGWLGVVTSVFYRPGGPGGLLGESSGLAAGLAWLTLGLAAAVLVLAAFVFLVRRATPWQRSFVLALALVPFAALAIADLATGGRRATVDRYVLPCWLAIELAVAFFVAAPGPWPRARRVVLVVVLALGTVTILRTRPLDVWWNTDPEGLAELGRIEARLAAAPDTIVLTDAPPLRVLELARRLAGGTVLRLGIAGPAQIAADEWRHATLFDASPALLAQARRAIGPGRALVRDDPRLPLWRIGTSG